MKFDMPNAEKVEPTFREVVNILERLAFLRGYIAGTMGGDWSKKELGNITDDLRELLLGEPDG